MRQLVLSAVVLCCVSFGCKTRTFSDQPNDNEGSAETASVTSSVNTLRNVVQCYKDANPSVRDQMRGCYRRFVTLRDSAYASRHFSREIYDQLVTLSSYLDHDIFAGTRAAYDLVVRVQNPTWTSLAALVEQHPLHPSRITLDQIQNCFKTAPVDDYRAQLKCSETLMVYINYRYSKGEVNWEQVQSVQSLRRRLTTFMPAERRRQAIDAVVQERTLTVEGLMRIERRLSHTISN